MYPYPDQTQIAIKGMIEASQSFDVEEIKSLTEAILKDCGEYRDPIVEQELKNFMLTLFEYGRMPGYCLVPKYVCDEDGPKITLEFVPENAYASLTLIHKPEKNGKKVTCTIHDQYKEFIKRISDKAGCSQDMMVRSILIHALEMINDHLK